MHTQRLRRLVLTEAHLHLGSWVPPASAQHYLHNVLRLKAGDSIEVIDGQQNVGIAVLQADLSLDIIEISQQAEPNPRVTCAVATPKGERADWLVEKLTEVGIYQIYWLQTQRSVARQHSPSRQKRWIRLAEAAAQQSNRRLVPQVSGPLSLAQFMEQDTATLRYVGDKQGRHLPSQDQPVHISLLIGPEGGFTSSELQHIQHAGYTSLCLSSYTLRVETAAVVGAGLLLLPQQTQ